VRIELLLAGGAGKKAIGRKFGLSKDSVHRHWRNHIPEERRAALILGPAQRQALSAQVAEESASVLDHYRAIRAGLYTFFTAALEAGDRMTGAHVGGKLKDVNDSIAKLTGELSQSPLVQHNTLQVVMGNPQVQGFLQELACELKPYPDALGAVVRWLEAREACLLEAAEASVPAAAVSTPRAPSLALEHAP
jgi:hypothetical protein